MLDLHGEPKGTGKAAKAGGPHPLALRWTAIDPSVPDTTLQAFHLLGTAADWPDFRNALAKLVAPAQVREREYYCSKALSIFPRPSARNFS
eukprot:SAG22_NODE_947_length_6367_cov_23.437460_5_plen_91_part_00